MAEPDSKKDDKAENIKIVHTYPLVQSCDMSDEIKAEAIEVCVTACEKFGSNNEAAAKMIKEHLDKKFGPSFHVVVGESFSFEVTYETKSLLHMFFSGSMGCIIWKCA